MIEFTPDVKPYMDEEDIRIIESVLLNFKKDHLDVLEWGSGGSTLYFPRFLSSQGISYTWTSIEHNKSWFETVLKAVEGIPHVRLNLVRFDGPGRKLRKIPMKEYIEWPRRLNQRYDLILVDGRKRQECLLEAPRHLKPGGLVLLHDAQRKRYHRAFRIYPYSRFLGYRIWIGGLKAPQADIRLKNYINYFYYAYIYYLYERLRRLFTKAF
ncbi:hypothetical protein [Thermosulfuriphilus sp.]